MSEIRFEQNGTRFEQNGTRGWNIYRDRPSIQNVKIGDIAIQGVDEPRLNLLDYVVTGEVLAIGRFMVELIKPPRAELEKPELPPDSPEAKLDAQEWVGPKGVKISGTELLRRIHIADSDYKAHYLISWNIGGKLRIDRKHLYVRTK